jgi:hypothetical protein
MAAKRRRFDALRLLKAQSLSKGKEHKGDFTHGPVEFSGRSNRIKVNQTIFAEG